MPEIDWSVVATVMSSITAVVAVAAPVISSVVTVKSQERIKKNDLYMPRVYDALADLSLKYSQLIRTSTANDKEEQQAEYLRALSRIQDFTASCYVVMSLMPSEQIQQQIMALLSAFSGTLSPDSTHDRMFCQLTNDINNYLRTSKVKNPKKHAKQ